MLNSLTKSDETMSMCSNFKIKESMYISTLPKYFQCNICVRLCANDHYCMDSRRQFKLHISKLETQVFVFLLEVTSIYKIRLTIDEVKTVLCPRFIYTRSHVNTILCVFT